MQQSVPSLKKCCVSTLIRCRRFLGDVGYMDVPSLRELLYHCSVEELRCIEDTTLERSNRDLSWYTWDYWLEHYRNKFGFSRSNVQAQPLPTEAPEDYMPPSETEAAADWRRAYYERKQKDAALVNRLGQQVKAMYQQAEAERVSKQAQVCAKVQGDKVRRRSAPAMIGVKRPAPVSAPADKQKAKVLKSIGLVSTTTSSSSRAAPPGSKKVTITRTVTPQPPRPTPHAASAPSARLNPATAARLTSHSKAGSSASYPPTKPAPGPTARPLAVPSKPSAPSSAQRPLSKPSALSPSPALAPSSRPKAVQPTSKALPTTALPSTTRLLAPSSKPAGYKQLPSGRLPQSSTVGSRPASGSTAKPPVSDLSQMSDAQLEAELARRKQASVTGLRIIDEDDY